MQRPTAVTALALALASVSLAQAPPRALAPQRIPTAVKHAGVFHLRAGTWTRTGGQVASFGPDVIYSNTAPSGYFSSAGGAGGFAPGSENFDEGGVPGTTNGHVFASAPDRDEYLVNGITIGYCDMGAPGSSGFALNFFNSYTPCTFDQSPDDGFIVMGLPAAGGCWTVGIDLTGGSELCLQADGGYRAPGWDDDPTLDSFGWSWRYAGTDGAPGNDVGFLLAGNPGVTDANWLPGGLPLDGSNTYFGATQCAGLGSGYLARDFWWIGDPTGTNTGCYFFGGYSNSNGSCSGPSNPWASYHFELAAETEGCAVCVMACSPVYCQSNPNTTGLNGGIELTGSAVAADDNLTMLAFQLPPGSFGFFLTSQTQGFVANPAGSQGNLCVLGEIGRFVGPGQIKDSGPMGEISLSTTLGEFSLTALPTPTSSYAATTGITSNFQLWHRDFVIAPTSNFTDGVTVTWL